MGDKSNKNDEALRIFLRENGLDEFGNPLSTSSDEDSDDDSDPEMLDTMTIFTSNISAINATKETTDMAKKNTVLTFAGLSILIELLCAKKRHEYPSIMKKTAKKAACAADLAALATHGIILTQRYLTDFAKKVARAATAVFEQAQKDQSSSSSSSSSKSQATIYIDL